MENVDFKLDEQWMLNFFTETNKYLEKIISKNIKSDLKSDQNDKDILVPGKPVVVS